MLESWKQLNEDRQFSQLRKDVTSVIWGQVQAWLKKEELKGDKGDKGDKGEQGPRGLQGPQGLRGERGVAGVDGKQGPEGKQGPMGLQGPKGEKGDPGKDGKRGKRGQRGKQGPKGDVGPMGPPGPPGSGGGGAGFFQKYRLFAEERDPQALEGKDRESWWNTATNELFVKEVDTWTSKGTLFSGGGGGVSGDISVDSATTDYIDFNQSVSPSVTRADARMWWNDDDGTVNLGLPGSGQVNLQLGQEVLLRARNTTGTTIANGAVVYISGASGNRPTIALADADLENAADKTIGVATQDIADNNNGYVCAFGLVRDIDTSTFAEGATLYLSQTAGALTTTAPASPAHRVVVGHCVTSHATEGVILVDVNNGEHLSQLHDVSITSLTDNDILQYNSSTSLWENTALTVTESQISDFGTYIPTSQKGAANGVAPLGADSKIASAYLPALALTDVSVVANEAAQLALADQEEGDVAIRTDENKSYIHNGGTAGTMADWEELLTPTDAVLSVNGQTGTVSLDTDDIAEATNLYYTEARVSANTDVAAATSHIANTSNPHSVTKAQVGLGNVENTALSTWAGSTSLTTLGTIATGTWQGTQVANSYIADLPASKVTSGTFDAARIPDLSASYAAVDANAAWQPPTLADLTANNNSIYYSSDQSALCYKDGSGTVFKLHSSTAVYGNSLSV